MFTVNIVSTGLVVLTVAMHLFLLRGLTAVIPRITFLKHLRMGYVILGAIVGHLAEIWVFSVAIRWLALSEKYGRLEGAGGYITAFYYSAVTYTCLGYGDVVPTGALRLFAAVESLTGVVLLAWTASFAFVAMQRLWPTKLAT